jgi:DNA-binding response OmpR family regulator
MSQYCGLKLLIVDDTRELLESLKDILEQFGFVITLCNNVDIAVNAIKKDFYDLVLTDIEMPVKTGLDLIKILREGLDLSIPIIIMTGRATTEYLAEAIKVGASDFIPKPINTKALLQIINNQITKAKRLKLDFNLTHSLQTFKKTYTFQPKEFLENSIVEFLNTEIKKNFELNAVKRNEIYLILEEMITNAFVHGLWSLSKQERQLDKPAQYKIINEKQNNTLENTFVNVCFEFKKESKELIIIVKDSGKGFDFKRLFEKNFNNLLDSTIPTGRGLFLIKTLTKSLTFYDNGTKLKAVIDLNNG